MGELGLRSKFAQLFDDDVDFAGPQWFNLFQKSVQIVHAPESHIKDVALLASDLIGVDDLLA